MTQEEVLRWIVAAVADGWTIKPTYAPAETVDCAASLGKNGYQALTLARMSESAGVSVWGPDELAIKVSFPYDWDAMVAGTKVCCYCGAVGDTVRIGFAGRCCPGCREEHKAKIEYRGWCD